MSESKDTTVHPAKAAYVGYRAELLAQLALTRIEGLSVHRSDHDYGFDLVVTTPSGQCFFVVVKAFSSIAQHVRSVETIDQLRYSLDRRILEWARECPNPVFLFLIDADTDHGRFVLLSDLPPSKATHKQTVRLPASNTIDAEGLERLLATVASVEPRKKNPNNKSLNRSGG